LKRAETRDRNIAAEVREWALVTHSHFLVTDCYQQVTLVTKQEKHAALVTLRRMVDEGLLEHSGTRNGQYRLVQSECDDIDYMSADDKCLDLWLPLGMNKLVEIMPGNIIVLAGVANAGKTRFC